VLEQQQPLREVPNNNQKTVFLNTTHYFSMWNAKSIEEGGMYTVKVGATAHQPGATSTKVNKSALG
jgi:hypothetical protein